MNSFAYKKPSDFFRLLSKADTVNATGLTSFRHPLMIFEGDAYLHLYKPVDGIIYATKIEIDEDKQVPYPNNEAETIPIDLDAATTRLMREYSGEIILKPLDWSLMLREHHYEQSFNKKHMET